MLSKVGGKMKKFFSVLVLVLLISFPLLAVDTNGVWTNTTGTLNSTGEGQNALLKATFTIDKATVGDQVVVGFTSQDLSSSDFDVLTPIDSNITSGVTLSDLDKDGIAESTGTINAYAQITSFNNLTVTLSIKEKMQAYSGDEPSSLVDSLGWHVKSGEDFDLHIDDSDTTEDSTTYTLLDHEPTASNVSSAEYAGLTIVTDNYRDKKPGTYTGTVYVTVTADAQQN